MGLILEDFFPSPGLSYNPSTRSHGLTLAPHRRHQKASPAVECATARPPTALSLPLLPRCSSLTREHFLSGSDGSAG